MTFRKTIFRPRNCCLLAILSFVSFPARASATPVTINFSGNAICVAPSPFGGQCDAQGTFSANFQFDPSTQSIVGAWSAAASPLSGGFPFASSDGTGAVFFEVFHGEDLFDFSGEGIELQLFFNPANLQIPVAATVSVCENNPADCSVGEFTSGVSPEPSSLLLLATGLLSLVPYVRWRRRSET